ncbi:hypothetical protein [Myxococcus xanthus]|uniref:Uncharacterized protein n=1 Tax=Myxococcus xanthus TaxID=34 RepID=A0A7Y4II04_MYXXA|nr:hypothetical protein [Myxococcus xanthus]NOJ79683.1 hypothetical protein [Myxococcus xanthus]NOJ88536.1 hypothetical protein [Myxococcus xanthus]
MKRAAGKLFRAIATVLMAVSADAQPIHGVYRGEVYFTPTLVIPTSRPAGTYRVDTRVYTSNGSQTLLYRNDTTFTAS